MNRHASLDDFEAYLGIERFYHLTKNRRNYYVSQVASILLTVAILWQWFDPRHILLWVMVVLSWHAAYIYLHEASQKNVQENYRSLLNRHCFFAVINGLCWGVVPLIFFTTESPIYTLLIVTQYLGYMAGCLSYSLISLKSFLGFSLAISMPVLCRFFIESDMVYQLMGLTSIGFLILLTNIVARGQASFDETMRLHYDNLKLLERVEQERARAQQAIHAKNQFLAAASHDLRQPLNAVNLFVDALQPMHSGKEYNEIIHKIRLALRGMNEMFHGLLDISKLDANSVDNYPQHLWINDIAESLINEVVPKAGHLKIHNQITHRYAVFVDPIVLTRIIRNILDNAVKYTLAGSVEINANQQGDHIVFTIEDSGIGIEREKLESVFDEFYQLNNPERSRTKGLGLGLAIVDRLCKLSNIDIKLSSTLGVGTEVTLRIPKGDPSEISSDSSNQKKVDLTGMTVVVIDDDQDIVDGASRVLTQWGCRTVCGNNLREVLQALTRESQVPDIILSDYRLAKGENGLEAIECIRSEFNIHIPALIITGDTSPDKVALMKRADCLVLYKPINSSELKEGLEATLENSGQP